MDKEKFMFTYYGQHVGINRVTKAEGLRVNEINICPTEHFQLKLRPISSATNEEIYVGLSIIYSATELSAQEDQSFTEARKDLEMLLEDPKTSDNIVEIHPVYVQQVIDFFRTRGFAMPWRNLSVQDLVDLNWIIIE